MIRMKMLDKGLVFENAIWLKGQNVTILLVYTVV